MFLVKYGIAATESNLDGTSMTGAAFSDTVGGTTNVTLAEGDYVMAIEVVDGTTIGTIYLVHDGDPWEVVDLGTTPGDLFIGTAPDVPYQRGSLFAFLDTTNEFVSINQAQTIAIAEAIAGA
ncbi:MAG: hypothetical protein ACKO04_03990 [Actinomycetes bacterium]